MNLMVRNTRSVTTTEYALILAAIAILAYGTYRALGNSIGSLVSGIDSSLTVGSRGASESQVTPSQ